MTIDEINIEYNRIAAEYGDLMFKLTDFDKRHEELRTEQTLLLDRAQAYEKRRNELGAALVKAQASV